MINTTKARRSGFTFAGVEHGCGVHVPRARMARLRQTEASPSRHDASEIKIALGPGKFSTVTGTNSVAVVGLFVLTFSSPFLCRFS